VTDYSYAELEGLWINAGGPKALAPVAAAIAEAESGGNSDAYNPNDNNGTQSSYGLWQISTGTHTPPSPNWADPATNAKLAVGKWQGAGRSFSPWGTFDSGAYKAYLSSKTTPQLNVPGSPTATLTAAAASAGQTGAGGTCLVSAPQIGPSFLGIGGGCLFSKSNARAFIGTGILLLGALTVLPGLAMLGSAAVTRVFAPAISIAERTPVARTYVQVARNAPGAARSAVQRRKARREEPDVSPEVEVSPA
jgi:hypothetical protein